RQNDGGALALFRAAHGHSGCRYAGTARRAATRPALPVPAPLAPRSSSVRASAVDAAAGFQLAPQRSASGWNQNWAVLTQAMLENKDDGYDVAMEHLRRGGTVFYDGLCLTVRRSGEVWLVAVASVPLAEMDEIWAQRDAEPAHAVLEALARLAPEVAAAV